MLADLFSKVEKTLDGCLDLIPSLLPSMKIQIMGEKIRKSRVQIPAPEDQKKLQILHIKCISLSLIIFDIFFYKSIRYQFKNKYFYMLYLISK